MHGSYHLPDDEVLSNACVQLLPGCQNILRYVRHAGVLYRLLKAVLLSTALCVHDCQTDTEALPEVIPLRVSFQSLPIPYLHNHLPDPAYP